SKEFSVPISLVQVAWFENPHSEDLRYEKDLRVEIVLRPTMENDAGDFASTESRVNLARFTTEMDVAAECAQRMNQVAPGVVFSDGSFVLSFTGRMPPATRSAYLAALFRLLDTSRTIRVPLVGYIDLSYASDLCGLLGTAFDLPDSRVTDAQILKNRLGLFERTAAFRCARSDIMQHYHNDSRDYSRDICFVYLKVGTHAMPARIDFPSWILDAGMLDRVIDVVRAEIIAGSGYPYCLEAADAAAVLTTEDRLRFYRTWQEFAGSIGLEMALPGKTVSKLRRR
ncbi:MAG: DNA double-strand break repair nuclease NurA, partial [Chloroflexota bacterium]